MFTRMRESLEAELRGLATAGLWKEERILSSPQGVYVWVEGRKVLNLCSNNYLGLDNHPELIRAAKQSLDKWGYGVSSVRFICGTQTIHTELEKRISLFFGTEDTLLCPSCFDANAGLFEALLSGEDAVISDELNHASLIDGIRLCKAQRYRFRHLDVTDLERQLGSAAQNRFRVVVTDGVFSMDGDIAPLEEICRVAEQHDALVVVDDSHATGVLGKGGRGTPEYCGVMDRVDLMTSTLGKAMGGASGGFATGRREVIEILRQRSRPYLFSNTLPPVLAGAALVAFDLVEKASGLRERVEKNTAYFRKGLQARGFRIKEGFHPIIPLVVGEAQLVRKMARDLLDEGVYVVAFSYPVVPRGQDRVRIQISAAHGREDLDFALEQFTRVAMRLGII